MPSLSSLIVQRQVATIAEVEQAIARQVIHGGDLVTNLLEVMLFKDDLLGVLRSTARALWANMAYLGHNILPMIVMFVPMMAILVQIVSHYALDPVPVGAVELVTARVERASGVKPTDVRLELPAGVVLDAPPVRTADGEIVWRVKADLRDPAICGAVLAFLLGIRAWAWARDRRRVGAPSPSP